MTSGEKEIVTDLIRATFLLFMDRGGIPYEICAELERAANLVCYKEAAIFLKGWDE